MRIDTERGNEQVQQRYWTRRVCERVSHGQGRKVKLGMLRSDLRLLLTATYTVRRSLKRRNGEERRYPVRQSVELMGKSHEV